MSVARPPSPQTLEQYRSSSVTIYQPYTYWLYHKPTKKFYYGSRTAIGCHPKDLWKDYFSSSNPVKEFIDVYGINSFRVKEHKTFKSANECLDFEYSILNHFKAGSNPRFLNKHHTRSIEWTDDLKEQASKRMADKNPCPVCGKLFNTASFGIHYNSHLGIKSIYITNGIISKRIKSTDDIPDGFYRGRIPFTQNTLKKMSIAKTGKKHSPDTIQKMSVAAKKRWSNSTNIADHQKDYFR
jgi:hypothetical protein